MKVLKIVFLFIIIALSQDVCANEIDSLLNVLDDVVKNRQIYTVKKDSIINEKKQSLRKLRSFEKRYACNQEIINEYDSYLSDSAEFYICENIKIAKRIGDKEKLLESQLRLTMLYSVSGMFVEANEIFEEISYNELPNNLKLLYCWDKIRYYENLMRYSNAPEYSNLYEKEKDEYRLKAISLLTPGTDMYDKERIVLMEQNGKTKEAVNLMKGIFGRVEKGTHDYAMSAMALSRAYSLDKDKYNQEKYLIEAAITDIQLSVKENEALLELATILYHKGDIDRAFSYIKAALDDAVCYNSRFRNTVISRVYPIVEKTYLYRLDEQRKNLRLYLFIISAILIALVIVLYYSFRQKKAVLKARKNLKEMNDRLRDLNRKLDESNVIKERYIGYFLNLSGIYVNKLDEYRKYVNRKLKTKQYEDLYQSSSRPFGKDLAELYENFDHVFLKIFPNFVTDFNSLLRPEGRFKTEPNEMNTEMRIFALIRLGIENVGQIASFLNYSVQTIYNYKSKVKKLAINTDVEFEDEVMKIGVLEEEEITESL